MWKICVKIIFIISYHTFPQNHCWYFDNFLWIKMCKSVIHIPLKFVNKDYTTKKQLYTHFSSGEKSLKIKKKEDFSTISTDSITTTATLYLFYSYI